MMKNLLAKVPATLKKEKHFSTSEKSRKNKFSVNRKKKEKIN